MTTDKQQAVLPTIAEIEDTKDNCERFEKAIKELQSAHEAAYSAGMVEGERVCMGKIAELEAALDVALEAMEAAGSDFVCQASHHEKKDQHGYFHPCPVQQRWNAAIAKLKEVRK